MIKQKEAVFAAYTAGVNNGMEQGSDQLFDHVASTVEAGLRDGTVEYGKDRTDEKAVKSYSRSVTSNWLKKDERIAGTKYIPATKRGPQVKDERLKALNTSLKSLRVNDPNNMTLISRVEQAISARKAEIQAGKDAAKVQSLDEAMDTLAQLGIEV